MVFRLKKKILPTPGYFINLISTFILGYRGKAVPPENLLHGQYLNISVPYPSLSWYANNSESRKMLSLKSKHSRSISLPEGTQRERKGMCKGRSCDRLTEQEAVLSLLLVFIRHSDSRPFQTACGLLGGPRSHEGPMQTHVLCKASRQPVR